MENKKQFCQGLGDLLMMYSRFNVREIDYVCTDSGTELAKIVYMDNSVQYQDISGDSCIAIMQDIAKCMM